MSVVLDVQRASASEDLPGDAQLLAWAEGALAGRRREAELTLRIVDEAESAELNQTYRGRPGPTNVLSFPFEAPPGLELPLLGDLVICAPVVEREAAAQGKPPRAHWAHMVVHGILHLLGYDHMSETDAQVMEALEIEILNTLGYPDPYIES